MPVCQTRISEGKTPTVIAFSMKYSQRTLVKTCLLSAGSLRGCLGFLATQPAQGERLQACRASREVCYTFQIYVQ